MVCVACLLHTRPCIAFPSLQISHLCVFCDILSPKAVYRVSCCFFRPKMFSPGDRVWYHARTLGAHVLATVVGPSPNGPQARAKPAPKHAGQVAQAGAKLAAKPAPCSIASSSSDGAAQPVPVMQTEQEVLYRSFGSPVTFALHEPYRQSINAKVASPVFCLLAQGGHRSCLEMPLQPPPPLPQGDRRALPGDIASGGGLRGCTVCCARAVQKVGCLPPPQVATDPRVLDSAPYSPCWYTKDFF